MSVFEASAISLFYGKKQRLFDVSLPPLLKGDLLGVLGANAAGKSSLMGALSGQATCKGEIKLNGQPRQQIRQADWMQSVAHMPQTPPQESSLLPYELLWSAARAMGLMLSDAELKQRIEELLVRLGIEEFALSPLYTLSGGKRQLVGLALALIRDPQVLLLDEPTSALDLHWRLVVLDLIQERLQVSGGAAVAAIHDLDLAARYCTKLIMLKQGKVIACGNTESVLTQQNIASVFNVEAEVGKSALGHLQVQVIRPVRP